MSLLPSLRTACASLLACFFLVATLRAEPVKVFILAGQSNMEGKAQLTLMEHHAKHIDDNQYLAPYRDGDKWTTRDDVWIKFLGRKGDLTVGFGSPQRSGPELGFGRIVGDYYDEQVLIIKTAWGGKSLYRDFRPPSSGLPPADKLDEFLARVQKKKPETTLDDIKSGYGYFYREMLTDVRQTLGNLKEHFPEYDGEGYELCGFVWFQGWNDMVDATATDAYEQNMANFIRDVRKDLKAPNLPFVIGQLGVGGTADKSEKKLQFKAAQIAPAELDEFKDNVAVVKTDAYWDTTAEAVFQKGWKKHLDTWVTIGSDRPYHYLGSARTYLAIGEAFGDSVLKLRDSNYQAKAQTFTLAEPIALPEDNAPVKEKKAKKKKKESVFYDPIEKQIEGWTVKVDPELLKEENKELSDRAFKALANHLQRITYIVPEDKVAQLRKLPIWIDLNHKLSSMQYHPGRGWLVSNGYDPRLVKHVHIPRAKALLDRGQWAKHPYVVLHELAHAYHDQVLDFDNEEVVAAYKSAKEKGIYEKVLLYTGNQVEHYGLTNQMEYFAECTESYFGVNDFYPFVRAELKQHDPKMYGLLQKIWGPIR